MAFSMTGVATVIFMALGPIVPLLVAVVAINLVLIALALRAGRPLCPAAARRAAAGVMLGTFVLAFLILPTFTAASFASLSGALDWIALSGAALLIGILCGLLSLPLLAFVMGRRGAAP